MTVAGCVRTEGIVEEDSPASQQEVRVRVLRTSACAGCQNQNHCAGTSAQSFIVNGRSLRSYTKGEKVIVELPRKKGLWAVFFAFVIPMTLALAAFFGISLTLKHEGGASGAFFLVLVAYYLVLYGFKKHAAQTFPLEVKKK